MLRDERDAAPGELEPAGDLDVAFAAVLLLVDEVADQAHEQRLWSGGRRCILPMSKGLARPRA